MHEKMGAPGRGPGPGRAGGTGERLCSVPRRDPDRLWLYGWIAVGWPVAPGSAASVYM